MGIISLVMGSRKKRQEVYATFSCAISLEKKMKKCRSRQGCNENKDNLRSSYKVRPLRNRADRVVLPPRESRSGDVSHRPDPVVVSRA